MPITVEEVRRGGVVVLIQVVSLCAVQVGTVVHDSKTQ